MIINEICSNVQIKTVKESNLCKNILFNVIFYRVSTQQSTKLPKYAKDYKNNSPESEICQQLFLIDISPFEIYICLLTAIYHAVRKNIRTQKKLFSKNHIKYINK